MANPASRTTTGSLPVRSHQAAAANRTTTVCLPVRSPPMAKAVSLLRHRLGGLFELLCGTV